MQFVKYFTCKYSSNIKQSLGLLFMQYAQIILDFINSKKVSFYKLAQNTGISESTFSKWKSNPDMDVSLTTIKKIADYFSVSIDSLIKSDGMPIVKDIGEDFIVTDNNAKLLISLLDSFDDEFDKIEFVSKARRLAKNIKMNSGNLSSIDEIIPPDDI